MLKGKVNSAIVIGLLQLACTSQPIVRCEAGDWFQQGFQDALFGKTSESIQEYQQTCQSAGVTVDDKKYNLGFRNGLRRFCQPRYGYEFGLQGQEYKKTCTQKRESAFLDKYFAGRRQFLRDEISDKKGLVESITEDLTFKERELASVTTDHKNPLSDDINKLRERREKIKDEITRLAKELHALGK